MRGFWPLIQLGWLIFVLLEGRADGGAFQSLRGAVFKIHVVSNEPNLMDPWKKMASQQSSGTGFYIGGGRILTNAHVVANAAFITVLRDGDSEPRPAAVRFIGHDSDLAVLEPTDPKVLDGVPALTFGSLPKLRSPVSTIGYPMGGEQLSITDGIVSRVSYRRYVHHGSAKHLLVQVDSAINPGNSGGPVVQGRLVVGVAFQSFTQAENTGYIIPTPVIRRFLRDIENGRYEGHPDDGLTTSDWTMLNPATSEFHELGPKAGGIKVAHVAPWAPTSGLIIPGDILLQIDDQAIGVDGKVSFEGERVDFRTVFDLKLMGDKAKFKLARDGKIQTVEVPIRRSLRHYSSGNIYSRHAKYFVYGGLVFTTLSRSLLRTWGEKWYRDAPLLLRFLDGFATFEPDFADMADIVVLIKRLPDAVNAYATGNTFGVVTAVDSQTIKSFEDLVSALEAGRGEFATIHFFGSEDPLVLSRLAVKERGNLINQKYGVVPDRWLKGPEDDGAMLGMEATK